MFMDNLDKDKASQGGVEQEEIGRDEAWFAKVKAENDSWFQNGKRTYDEYQHESLESIKSNRSYVSKVLSDAQQNDNTRQNIANQALQNAVESANMISKQAIAHRDIAIDREWNIDEVAQLVSSNSTFKDAIAAAVAKAVNEVITAKTN